MRYLFSILLIVFAALAPRPTLAGQPVILVLGDSLSAGHGIDRQYGWVQLLQNRLDQSGYAYRVVNASISGDTTDSGLSRLPYALKQHHPAIVIIELGGNDGLRGLTLAQLETNLTRLVILSKQAGAKVMLCRERIPPNLGPVYTTKFSKTYATVAKRQRVPLVPYLLKGVADDPKLMQDDGIHPNAKGQPGMLENVWPVLEPLLVKPNSKRNERRRDKAKMNEKAELTR
jgi:acyl-CoA thioesterase-1